MVEDDFLSWRYTAINRWLWWATCVGRHATVSCENVIRDPSGFPVIFTSCLVPRSSIDSSYMCACTLRSLFSLAQWWTICCSWLLVFRAATLHERSRPTSRGESIVRFYCRIWTVCLRGLVHEIRCRSRMIWSGDCAVLGILIEEECQGYERIERYSFWMLKKFH